MCGIVGILNLKGEPFTDQPSLVAMANQLQHRGPDDAGYLASGPVGFGFRRLSIIDLQTGHQPLSNVDQTIWVMFNGEIYNFVELRQTLLQAGFVFRTQSDTEVIVYAYQVYGLDFLRHLRGMFAIALWDTQQQRLVLARDRLGKKPLFYSQQDGQLAFASELKALRPWPHLRFRLNPRALHDYLTFLYIAGEESILEGVVKLPPAHMLVADCNSGTYTLSRYWHIDPTPDRTRSATEYAEALQETLSEAVRIRLRSDVPLGAFLSGGIDSTIIVGLMARSLTQVRTFSIGFRDKRFDESEFAQVVAAAFQTVHHNETIDAHLFRPDDLNQLVWYMDEPFADSSFIPSYWVARMARQHVTVALSGDGGDELFAGYTRYRHWQQLAQLAQLPAWVRQAGTFLVQGLYAGFAPLSANMAGHWRQIHKALQLSSMPQSERLLALLSHFDEAAKILLYTPAWRETVNGYHTQSRVEQQIASLSWNGDSLVGIMARDLIANLVDDPLVKVDRATMACSLELRSPFLDHKVVELALKIPPEYKMRGREQKVILKQAFADLLPQEITRRGKQGFELPFGQWFQQADWRTLLVDMLSATRLNAQGIFNPEPVLRLRDMLLQDPEARHAPMSAYQLRHQVWQLLIFQMWMAQWQN